MIIKRNVYLYKIYVEGVANFDVDKIFNLFMEKNIGKNIKNLDEEDYVFVTWKKENSLIGARFIKSRNLSPLKIDKIKSILNFINFGKNEKPGEPSNLIWDFQNNIIISEMNWEGARHISLKLGKYLKEILNKNIEIKPIFHKEEYKTLFLKKSLIKKISLSLAKPHINLVHDTIGADVNKMAKYVASSEGLGIEISIICKKKKKGLISKKVVDLYNKIKPLKNEKGIKLSVRDNKQNVLNLLEGSFIKDKINFEIDKNIRSIKKEDFFNKVRDFWENKKGEVLGILQND